MSISLPGVADAIIAISTIAGIAILFTLALLGASALVRRDKARNARTAAVTVPATPSFAQQPTQTDRVLELAGR
jgi:LPS O-antigen subunit length determinant protein (WzzB/FepE family)